MRKEFKEYNLWEQEYINKVKINILCFMNSKCLEKLKKLNIIIDKRKYTEYEFHIIEMQLYEWYNELEKLKKLNFTKKEYEDILNIFRKISSYYEL